MNDNDGDMEDDIDETVEVEDEPDGGVFRWMSVVVVLLAVAGFFGLAWYAYKSGGEVVDEKDAELIHADSGPVKELPANPGGMPIPNQDKSVYNLVGGKQDEGKVVEHILASPETPVARNDDSETGTWMSDQVKEKLKAGEEKNGLPLPPLAPSVKETQQEPQGKEQTAKPAEAPPKPEQFKPAKEQLAAPVTEVKTTETPKAAEKPNADSVVVAKTEVPKEEINSAPKEKLAAVVAKPVEPKAVETQPAQPKPVESKVAGAVHVAEKKAAESAPAKAAAAAPSSGSRAQLGAFKSQSEAEGQWNKIVKKFASSVSGKDHYVVRADLGDKGVFYRLQTGPFSSSREVERFCLDLVSDGQGCFTAKGK